MPNTLSAAEGDDLLDALTELAPNLGGLQRAMWAVGKVRTTLASTWLTPYALEDERDMDRALYLYVGSPLAFDALDGKLDEAARAFEAQATAGLSVLDAATATRVRANALIVLTAAPACLPRLPVQTPLDMAPPEERAWACSLVHALDDAHTDEDELAVDLAWHDAVVVARWALSTHGPVRSVDAAERLARPMLALPPVERTRLMRLARARPMHAIAVGVAAMILMKQGPAHASARAHKWRGIGDAPDGSDRRDAALASKKAPDALGPRDDDEISAADEETGLDDARNRPHGEVHARGIVHRSRAYVDDVVGCVGDEDSAVFLPLRHRAQATETLACPGVPEAQHLDGHGPRVAEPSLHLALVDDDDIAPRGGVHDLLARQRAAASLDEVQPFAHLVGAVDRHGEVAPLLLVTEERNAERLGLLPGPLRRGHTTVPGARLPPRADFVDEQLRRRPGAQADDAGLRQLFDGGARGELLRFVLVHGRGR